MNKFLDVLAKAYPALLFVLLTCSIAVTCMDVWVLQFPVWDPSAARTVIQLHTVMFSLISLYSMSALVHENRKKNEQDL